MNEEPDSEQREPIEPMVPRTPHREDQSGSFWIKALKVLAYGIGGLILLGLLTVGLVLGTCAMM